MAENTMPLFGGSCKFYVYIYRDPRPRKKKTPFYVGKGSLKRADSHWANGTHNAILKNILRKIRSMGLEPIIEIVSWFDNEGDAFEHERCLIAQFGRRDKGKGPLCNLTDGGEGGSGYKWTPEQRAKAKNKTISQEQRAKISKTLMGTKLDTGRLARVRAANKKRCGIPLTVDHIANVVTGRRNGKGWETSEETRAKISATQKARLSSPEARARLSNSCRGKVVTLETRARLSQFLKTNPKVQERMRGDRNPSKREDLREKMLAAAERRAKLSADDVIEIRSLAGVLSQRAIAEKYGVDQSRISKIQNGKSWSHLV